MSAVTLGANIFALRAQRRLSESSEALARSTERLSSGLRINRASDDAAGLAISSSLRKDTRVYAQAIRNGNDAISALNIAEGTVSQLSNITMRLQELATQAANGSFSRVQRLSIDKEGAALTAEFNRLVGSVDFNGLKFYDGSTSGLNAQIGYGQNGSLSLGLGTGLSRNLGRGLEYSSNELSAISLITNVVTGDFNGDGIQDYVQLSDSADLSLSLGRGDGTFNAPVIFSSTPSAPADLMAGDINGDGKDDLVIGGGFSVLTFFGNASGSFTTGSAFSSLMSSTRLVDVNSDGKLDIVGSGTNSLRVHLNNGNGTFASAMVSSSATSFNAIELGDVTGDGIIDIVQAQGNAAVVFAGNNNGSFNRVSSLTLGVTIGALAIGDLDHDGLADVIASSADGSSTVSVMKAQSSGQLSLSSTISTSGDFIDQLALVDMDGDGELDIVGARDTNIGQLKGRGNGTFDSQITYSAADIAGAGRFSIADFNRDGVNDLILTGEYSDKFHILLNRTETRSTIERIDLTTRQNGLAALSKLSAVSLRIQRELSAIGSQQSRLSSALNAIAGQRLAGEAAAGRIDNADIAAEAAQSARQAILQQVSASILGQANQAPQLALMLLGR